MGVLKQQMYQFRSPNDITIVMEVILKEFPKLIDAKLAVWELMCNAVEHGVLGISFEEKTKLMESGGVDNEINKRLNDKKYKKLSALIEVKEFADEYVVFVCDDGAGFAWKNFLDKNILEITGLHGRGIPISETFCETLTYIGNGNKVVAVFVKP